MLRSALLVVLALLLASPAGAFATNRFVRPTGFDTNNPCTDSLAPCQTIQRAVSQSGDGDTVHVGPGSYTGAVSATNKVFIVGAGAGQDPDSNTVLQPSSGFAIRMFDGGGVSNMRVTGGGSASAGQGIVLSATGTGASADYLLRDLVVIGGATASGAGPAIHAFSAGSDRVISAKIEDSLLRVPQPAGGPEAAAVRAEDDRTIVSVERTEVRGGAGTDDAGFSVEDGAVAILGETPVGIDGSLTHGLRFDGVGSNASVFQSRIAAQTGIWAVADDAGEQLAFTVRESVVGPLPGQPGMAVAAGGGPGTKVVGNVAQSTLIGLSAVGAVYVAADDSTATVDLSSVIARNVNPSAKPDLFAIAANGGTGRITAKHSLFDRVTTQQQGSAPAAGSGTNVTGDPLFVNAAADDLRVSAGSPAIDRGDPAGVYAGEKDAGGLPRAADGDGDCKPVPDIGGHELQAPTKPCPVPPSPSAEQTPGAISGPTPVQPPFKPAPKPLISGLKVVAGRRAITATFTISHAASVVFAIQREAAGLRRGSRCAKPSKALRARRAKRCVRLVTVAVQRVPAKVGRNRISLSRRPGKGRYRALVGASGGAAPTVVKVTAG